MKKILVIFWKDTRIRFTGLTEWLFFLILPIIFTLVLAAGTGALADSRVRLVVVDQAHSPLSTSLIAALESSTTIRPDVQPLEKAERQFSSRQVSAALIIPSDFNSEILRQEKINLELRKQPNNTNALVAEQAVLAVSQRAAVVVDIATRTVAEAEAIRPFANDADRQAMFDATLQKAQELQEKAPQRIRQVTGSTPDQIEYDPAANSAAGQLITWVFIPLIGISGMFAYERQKGTLRRLLTTPTRKSVFLLGTILGQVLTALVQMLLLVGFGILVMKLDWGRDPAALALLMTSSALAAAAIGTALGTFVKTVSQADGLTIIVGMIMAMLGGCWYPIELFPQFIRSAMKVFPTTWSMQGMLDILVRGKSTLEILPTAGVLLGFAAVFFTIGILRFRYE